MLEINRLVAELGLSPVCFPFFPESQLGDTVFGQFDR